MTSPSKPLSATAYKQQSRELHLKYAGLRGRLAAGLPCNYTIEQLKEAEAREYAELEARRAVKPPVVETSLPPPVVEPNPPVEQPSDLSQSIPTRTPTQCCDLKPFQESAVDKLLSGIIFSRQIMLLLQAGTGTGKTFIGGAVIDRLIASNWQREFSRAASFHPAFWWITKPAIVTKTRRDLEAAFGLTRDKLLVTSYDQLRSSFGKQFFGSHTVMVNGEPEILYKPVEFQLPWFILWDECHSLKNEDSRQSRIAQSFNDLPPARRPTQMFMSATVGTKLADFKCICCAADNL